jgi:hypothetical protein
MLSASLQKLPHNGNKWFRREKEMRSLTALQVAEAAMEVCLPSIDNGFDPNKPSIYILY